VSLWFKKSSKGVLIEKDSFSYSRLLGTPPPMKSGETGSIPSRRVITTEVRRLDKLAFAKNIFERSAGSDQTCHAPSPNYRHAQGTGKHNQVQIKPTSNQTNREAIMLALSRFEGERIHVGDNIVIEVRRIFNKRVVISVVAPENMAIDREEIYLQKREFSRNKAKLKPKSKRNTPTSSHR
jgi:carbon storage regulator CsrA